MASSPPIYDFNVADAPAFDMLAAPKIAKLPPGKRRDKLLAQLKRAAKRVAPDAAPPDDVAAWTDDDVEAVVDALADAWDDASKRSFLTLLRDTLVEQEKSDLAAATGALAAAASPAPASSAAPGPAAASPAKPSPPSPTKPSPPSPTKALDVAVPPPAAAAAPEVATAPPMPDRRPQPGPRPGMMGMGIALPGLTGPPKPAPAPAAPAEPAASEEREPAAPAPAPVVAPASAPPEPAASPKPLEDVRKTRPKPPRPPRGKALHVVQDDEEEGEQPVEQAAAPAAAPLTEDDTPPPIPPLPVIPQSSPIELPGMVHADKPSAEASAPPVAAPPTPPAPEEPATVPAAEVPAPAAAPPPQALPPIPPRRVVPPVPVVEEHQPDEEPDESNIPDAYPVSQPSPGIGQPISPSPATSVSGDLSRNSVEARQPVQQQPSPIAPVAVAAAAAADHDHDEKKGGNMFSRMKSMFKKGSKPPKDGHKDTSPTTPPAGSSSAHASAELAPRASMASRSSVESPDVDKRMSVASAETPVQAQQPPSQVVPEVRPPSQVFPEPAAVPPSQPTPPAEGVQWSQVAGPPAGAAPQLPPQVPAQPSPPQRPSLPARPVSVSTDVGAVAEEAPRMSTDSAPRTSVDTRTSLEAVVGADGEQLAPEDGEEVKPKKYVPNAAMSALAAAMRGGVSPANLQKRRSAGNSLRAAAPVDVVVPEPSAPPEPVEHTPSESAAAPALPPIAEAPPAADVAARSELMSSTNFADMDLATPATIGRPTSVAEPSPAPAAAPAPAVVPSTAEEAPPSPAVEEPPPVEEPAVARKPKLVYGARPDAMVAAISGELKKRQAPPPPAAEEGPTEAGAEPPAAEAEEGAEVDAAPPPEPVAAAPKPAVPVRPKIPPKLPPKTSFTGPPQTSPSGDASAEPTPGTAEGDGESRATLEKKPTIGGPEVSWTGPAVPLVIQKKTAIDTSNDAVVEENMLLWLQKHVPDKEITKDNLYSSLTDGIVLIRALESASGASAGRYNKKAMMQAQQMDNLQVLINFMTKLGIETNNVRPLDFNNQERSKVLVAFVSILKKYGPQNTD